MIGTMCMTDELLFKRMLDLCVTVSNFVWLLMFMLTAGAAIWIMSIVLSVRWLWRHARGGMCK